MKISTSILSSKNRIESVLELNKTNTDYIHVDVMDGKFVEDVQFETYEKIHSIDLVSKRQMDIHLMVENPLEYINQLSNMNIEFITFHVEVKKDISKIINSIHDMGCKVGLAIKPGTDIKVLEKYLDEIDMVLVMSVEPGKGGQAFLESTVDRIKMIKELIGSRNILVEVDGGINDKTIDNVRDVDIVVVGSYIINSDNYYKKIEELRALSDVGKDEDTIKRVGHFDILRVIVKFNIIAGLLFSVYSFIFGIDFCIMGCVRVYGFFAFYMAAISYLFGATPISILVLVLFRLREFFKGKDLFPLKDEITISSLLCTPPGTIALST